MPDDLFEYEKLVIEHGLMGYARACLFDEGATNRAWHADLQRGVLDLDGSGSFRIHVLGSYSKESDTFRWVWANRYAEVSPAVAQFAESLRARAKSTPGLAAFSAEAFGSAYISTRELASVCGELAGGLPFYLGDFGQGAVVTLVDTKIDVSVRSAIWLQQVLVDFHQFSHADLVACTKRFLERCSFTVEETARGLRARRADYPEMEIAFDAEGRLQEIAATQRPPEPRAKPSPAVTSISPKTLVARMTPTARQMLETAVGRCASATHYEVTIEHVLREMIEPSDGDVAAIHRHFGVDPKPLATRVERLLQQMRSGSRSRPVFNGHLWKWAEDAWTRGSLEHGAHAIRTGHLFYALLLRPERYLGETITELESFDIEAVQRELHEALSVTREEIESAGGASPRPAPPHSAVEADLARVALRRRAKLPPLLGALRRVTLPAFAVERQELWRSLFIAALEGSADVLSEDTVLLAASEANAALEVLMAPRESAPVRRPN